MRVLVADGQQWIAKNPMKLTFPLQGAEILLVIKGIPIEGLFRHVNGVFETLEG
jgi:hypothetical protein